MDFFLSLDNWVKISALIGTSVGVFYAIKNSKTKKVITPNINIGKIKIFNNNNFDKANRDTLNEGTFNFWIRIKDNPLFNSPNSFIQFCNNKNFDSIVLTILKEKTDLIIDITINNLKYNLNAGIGNMLKNDMVVTITWTQEEIILYLNASIVRKIVR